MDTPRPCAMLVANAMSAAAPAERRRRLALCAIMAALYASVCWAPPLMGLLGLGFGQQEFWFLDTYAVLAASDVYFATVNYAYRAIFAIMMAPFLWSACSRADMPAATRRLSQITSVLLLGFLWCDGLLCLAINTADRIKPHALDLPTSAIMLAQQPFVAGLMIALLGFLVPFVRDSLVHLTTPSRQPAS